jgi:hypothetical protein
MILAITANFSSESINRLAFVMQTQCVFRAVGTVFVIIILDILGLTACNEELY